MSQRPSRMQRQLDTDVSAEKIELAVDTKNWAEAKRMCLKRLSRSKQDQVALRFYGLALAETGRLNEGKVSYESAVKAYPHDPVLLIKYSIVATKLHDFELAYHLSRQATALAPALARAWISLSASCYMQSKHHEAVAAAEQGLRLAITNDERTVLLTNLASNLRDLGRLDEALAACKEAISLMPDWEPSYTNNMMFLQSRPQTSAYEVKEAALLYASKFEKPFAPQWPAFSDRDADPHRRLRVAFISPDFNQHSVMYFVESLLPQLDRRQFQVIAIYLQWAEDAATLRVRRHTDEFHQLAGLDHGHLASRIMALNIDVLIDLAGHTAHNGLGAMARKPAPVQVTWLGFPGTTGLSAIDWRITDGIADQANADPEYTERLYRLPEIFCVYRPHSRQPLYRYQPAYQVRQAPVLHHGHITFGSCNGLSKVTTEVLRVWAQVLEAVPASRLLIEGKGLDSQTSRDEFAARCTAAGIPADRLDLIDRIQSRQYLTYHQIDIALDTFPLTGGTTSFDLLWMGVPMITMAGDSFRSRMGVTLLHGLGRPDWVAANAAEYVQIAQRLAANPDVLNTQRLGQRQQMESSALMDELRYARHFTTALRTMWHRWCAARQHASDKTAMQAAIRTWAEQPWPPAATQVTIAPGQMVSLAQAHATLQALTEEALATMPREAILEGQSEAQPISAPVWLKVLAWCEYLLDSIPNEPLALATLAEVELAHGHQDLAVTYARYAQESMQRAAGIH